MIRTLFTFYDDSDKSASVATKAAAQQATGAKYASGIQGILSRLKAGQPLSQAIAGGIGISQSSFNQQLRNEGVNPVQMNQVAAAQSFAAALATMTPDQANLALSQIAAQAPASIPTWALVAGALVLILVFLRRG